MSSMSRTVSTVSIAIGVIEILSASVSLIFGVIAVTSYSGHASVSTGFWALVVSTQYVYILVFTV